MFMPVHSGFDAHTIHRKLKAQQGTYVTGSAFERLLSPFPVRRARRAHFISVYVRVYTV